MSVVCFLRERKKHERIPQKPFIAIREEGKRYNRCLKFFVCFVVWEIIYYLWDDRVERDLNKRAVYGGKRPVLRKGESRSIQGTVERAVERWRHSKYKNIQKGYFRKCNMLSVADHGDVRDLVYFLLIHSHFHPLIVSHLFFFFKKFIVHSFTRPS